MPIFDLSFNPAVAVWTLISFGLVYYVISRKVYPLLNKILAERAAKIAADLAEAETKHQEADELYKQISERLHNIRLEERKIVSDAQEKARRAAEDRRQEYETEFDQLRTAKEEDLQKAERDFYNNLEAKAGKMLVSACEKILHCDLPEELQQRVLEKRIQELKKIKAF